MKLDQENPINILCDEIHKANKEKGFWKRENENIGEKLMLVVSELGEAMEAIRKGKRQEYVLPTSEHWEKDTFEDEITDTVIRLFDLCGALNIDLEWQLEKKLEYNSNRPKLHGKKF